MGYTKIGWQNSPNSSTPLTAENLDKMDSGIKKNSDDIEEANNAFSTFKTGEFETATTDISNLKQDNTTNKKDISGLKTDVSGAKSSINDLKKDIDKINPKITELESVTGQLNKDVSKAKEDITTLKQADQNIINKIGTKQNGKVIKASNTIAQDLQALDTAIKNGGAGGGGSSTYVYLGTLSSSNPRINITGKSEILAVYTSKGKTYNVKDTLVIPLSNAGYYDFYVDRTDKNDAHTFRFYNGTTYVLQNSVLTSDDTIDIYAK
jgi:predicted RNase H-like nuclease (RuvC/YqgF family)